MSHSHHIRNHNTMAKSHNTLVKTEERNLAAQVTFQHKKKKSCICKCILVIFILAGIVTSTIFLVHFLAQKLNLDQDYSRQLASKFILPSFSSLRSPDSHYSINKDYNADKRKPSSQEGDSISKWIDQSNSKIKNSSNKRRKDSSISDSSDATTSRHNYTNMQFWKYFQKENAHLHPNRVRKTDISNEEAGEVRVTIPQYAVFKGIKITEFGNRMFKFLSIPYANPPIGDLRFSEPVEYKPKSPDTVLDNTKYGAICPQFFDEILVKTVTPLTRNMSEDCLTLNVWTPKLPNSINVNISDKQPDPKSNNNLWTILTEETLDFEEDDNSTSSRNKSSNRKARHFNANENLLPVMVWIHGGGFSMGSTALDEYDGSVLSAFGNVVVVTINYRLGIFGFFNLDSPDATGNQGLKDQVMALKWVKKYIRNFGGDPNRITIFGQSAGSFAVGLHMISPNAKGLFRRAILQSGSPLVFDQFYSNTYNIAKRLVQYVECEEKDETENSTPPADSSTEATTNEEETEEENGEEESDDGKGDEKFHHISVALNNEAKSNFNDDGSSLRRRKRADDEGDDEEGDDEEEVKTTIASSTEGTTSTTEASSSTTTTSTKIPELITLSSSTSTTTTVKTTTDKDDEEGDDNEEDDLENKEESKPSSTLSTSTTSTTSTFEAPTTKVISTTETSSTKKIEISSTGTTEAPTTRVKSTTEKTFFTSPSISSTTMSPTLKKSTTEKSAKTAEDDLKKANKILKCMQSKSMKSLIKAQKNAMQNSMFPFSPNKHDSILPKMPGEVIKQDASAIFFHSNVEQVLLGVNKDEGSLYLHLTMPQLFPSENLTLSINRLSDLRAMLATNLTIAFKVPRAQAIIVANLLLSQGPEIDLTENLVKKYYQLIADLMFICPSVMLADELVKLNYQNEADKQITPKKKQVYFYRFNERPSVTQWICMTHHEEVQFVFGMPLKYPLKYNSKDLIFSKRIMKTWSHFAKTGEMLPQLDLQWPPYNKQQQLMELSAFESKLTEKLHEKNCNLFRIGFESFMKRRKRFIN